MKKFHFLFLFITSIILASCGSGTTASTSSDDEGATGLSLQATVTTPSASVSALPALSGLVRGGVPLLKTIDETAAASVTVHAEDLSGTTLTNVTPQTTDADGECELTGFTEAQLEAGVVVVAETSDGVEIHSVVQPETTDIDSAASTGDAIAAPVNTETDLGFAVLDAACTDLATCSATIDTRCVIEALPALVGSEDAQADDAGGFVEALLEAQANAFINATAGGTSPAQLMAEALGGAPTGLTGVVGATVSDVAVTDAVTNSLTVLNAIKDAYCAKDATTGEAPWATTKEDAGDDFEPGAMVGFFKRFVPSEIGEYGVAEFRAFGQSLPNVTGGMQMFGLHDEARQTAAQYFRQGAFGDPTKAGAAFGFMMAAFPAPPTEGNFAGVSFTGFDPQVGAMAANNTFLQYTGSTSTFADPSVIFEKFKGVLQDADRRQGCATGGTEFFGTFMSGFISNPTGFTPADHFGELKAPPGGTCTSNDGCLPCDTCTNSVCVSSSQTMGKACDATTTCDSITTCVGSSIAGFGGGRCMCTAGVPTGASAFQAGGSGPVIVGVAGGFTPPAEGKDGGPCRSASPFCDGTLSCTSSGTGHGMCVSGTFKKPPFAPCAANSECASDSCSSNVCSFGGSFSGGSRTVGQPCGGPADCASFFCDSGSCAAPPTTGTFSGVTTGAGLKADGQTCTLPNECASFICSAGVCTAGGTTAGTTGTGTGTGTGTPTAPSNLPVGSPCFTGTECASTLHCNLSTHMCVL